MCGKPSEDAGASLDVDGRIDLPESYYDQHDSDNVCYLCGKPEYKLRYDVTHFDFPFSFKECQCGLVKQTPMPNKEFFEWFFNSSLFFSAKKSSKSEIWGFYDYFNDEPSRLSTSRRRYRELAHIFEKRKPLDIMKIGPSTGTFLYVAREHGHNPVGCDVSSRFKEYARMNYGVRIDNGRFEQMGYKDESFDVIILFNVIENIPNQEEFLKEVRRTLRPGGYFISNFVDMKSNMIAAIQGSRYFLYRPPICYIYTLPVYRRVMEKFGFRVDEVHRDIRYMTLEKISTLLGWRWLHGLSRLLGVHKKPFPIYAYPSKLVVARKG